MATTRAAILGTGHYVPERVVTNKDLEKLMDTSDDWIQQRSGIAERRFAPDGAGASDLGVHAARHALEMAKLDAKQIDCIIFATLSPDYAFPGSGVLLQHKLGLSDIPAFDVRNQCSGYLYALKMVDAFIRAGAYENILVVGSEVHSSGIELRNRGRDVAVLFGDGAGATIFGPSDDGARGLLSVHVHAQGEFAKELWIEAPTSTQKERITPEMIASGRIYPQMNGRLVFKHACTRMPEVIGEALRANGLSLDQVDHFFPHQANMRINQSVAKAMGFPESKMYHNIQKYGNLSAGSIPTLLDEVNRTGALRPGDVVLLAGFGSGFTWGAAVLRW